MKDLIKRSYKAIKNIGLITDKTYGRDFIKKMHEELMELTIAYYNDHNVTEDEGSHYIEEVTDLATVCIMQIHHLGYDFIEEFEKVIIKNEKRVFNENKSTNNKY